MNVKGILRRSGTALLIIASGLIGTWFFSTYFSRFGLQKTEVSLRNVRVGWQRFQAGDQAFSLVIPPGYRTITRQDGIWVVPITTEGQKEAAPVMTIEVFGPSGTPPVRKPPARVFERGGQTIILIPAKGAVWERFEEVASSFEFIE
jgi:hypothetical protein